MFFQFVKKVEEEKNTKDGNDAKRAQVTSLKYISYHIFIYTTDILTPLNNIYTTAPLRVLR